MLSSNETKPDIQIINSPRNNVLPSHSTEDFEKYSHLNSFRKILTTFFISTILKSSQTASP